jgi:uncharacterized protein YjbI with pentapeptide repeats
MEYNDIGFPVDLGTWNLHARVDSKPERTWWPVHIDPEGGWYPVTVWQGDLSVTSLRVVWVGCGLLALQDPATGWYVRESTRNYYKSILTLTKGADDLSPNKKIDEHSTFGLRSSGQGEIGITRGTDDGRDRFAFFDIHNSNHDRKYTAMRLHGSSFGELERMLIDAGSQFPVLLITGLGQGLALAGQDFAEGGYLRSVAGADFSGAHLEHASFATLPQPKLSGCNFQNARMAGVVLTGCTELNGASFQGADLTGTDLSVVSPGFGWSAWDTSLDSAPPMRTLTAAKGGLGHLEVFGVAADETIVHEAQLAGGSWTGKWSQGFRGAGKAKSVFAITGATNGVEVFAIDEQGTLLHLLQAADGAWDTSWASGFMGAPGSLVSVTGAVGIDGHLELFAVDTSGTLHHNWQSVDGGPRGTWHSWDANSLGDIRIRSVTAVLSPPMLQVFAIDTNGDVRIATRDGNTWVGFGSPMFLSEVTAVSAALDVQGRLQAFIADAVGTVQRWRWDPNHGWSGGADEPSPGRLGGKPGAQVIRQAQMPNAALQSLAIASDGSLYNASVDAHGSWRGWDSLFPSSGPKMSHVHAVFGTAGAVEAFAVATDGTLYHAHSEEHSWLHSPNTTRCRFGGATLSNAKLSNGQPRGANFRYDESDFGGAVLDGTKLAGVAFVRASFVDAKLRGADLSGADLTGADLTGADLTGASLAGTDLTGAQLAGTRFDGCDLGSVVFGPDPKFGRDVNKRTSLTNAKNVPALSLGLDWSYLDLTGATFASKRLDLDGLNAMHTLFPDGVDLNAATMTTARLDFARIYHADLRKANLAHASLRDTRAKGARLDDANLMNADLQRIWLIADGGSSSTKPEAAQLPNAILVNAKFDEAHCDGVDFENAVFLTDPLQGSQAATAVNAQMNRADFGSATIADADLRGAQLRGAQFGHATLVGSRLPSCDLSPTSDELHTGTGMSHADIRGTQFADLDGTSPTNPANMDGVDLRAVTVSTSKEDIEVDYEDHDGKKQAILVSAGRTVLGTTTPNTTCPGGNRGPCNLASA